jgi:hypothetical protein
VFSRTRSLTVRDPSDCGVELFAWRPPSPSGVPGTGVSTSSTAVNGDLRATGGERTHVKKSGIKRLEYSSCGCSKVGGRQQGGITENEQAARDQQVTEAVPSSPGIDHGRALCGIHLHQSQGELGKLPPPHLICHKGSRVKNNDTAHLQASMWRRVPSILPVRTVLGRGTSRGGTKKELDVWFSANNRSLLVATRRGCLTSTILTVLPVRPMMPGCSRGIPLPRDQLVGAVRAEERREVRRVVVLCGGSYEVWEAQTPERLPAVHSVFDSRTTQANSFLPPTCKLHRPKPTSYYLLREVCHNLQS